MVYAAAHFSDLPGPGARLEARRSRFESNLVEAAEPHLGTLAFNVQRLARVLGMSVRTLQLRMRKLELPTPASWLRALRLERARMLLRIQAYDTVGEVAAAVGMSPSHFSRAFSAHTGLRPSALIHS